MKPLLPVVTLDTTQQKRRTLMDSSCSPATAKKSSEEELELIKQENPYIGRLIEIYSEQQAALFGDLSQCMAKVHMTSIYLLLRSQAEADRMKEEIKLS